MPPAAAPNPIEHFHPLEVIPFFRRFRASLPRDLLYTLVWNTLFGLAFYVMAALGSGRFPPVSLLPMYLLMANLIGFTIHALFLVGGALRLEAAARRAGFAAKVAYYAAVPIAGVLLGFALVSVVLERGLLRWVARPGVLVSMLLTSLIITLVLSVVFFWRERAALAQAALAGERARTERIEREAALANLRALQAQIEPHFLFNTLANVASLVDADPAVAKRMLESFIRFLRASLAATRAETTTLGAEAELIGAFLEVLQVRMGARLRYAIDVPPGLAARTLPAMLLQPVVENAIRHGLEPKIEGGEVAVRARLEDGALVLEVADTGVGFAPATRGGVGLANLRERLQLLHPGRARLAIAANAPAGSIVRITLPA